MNRNMKYCINSSGGGHGDQRQNDELFDAYSFGNSLASASFSNVDVGDGTDAIHNVPDSSYRYLDMRTYSPYLKSHYFYS